MKDFLQARVLVTGSRGFLGRHLYRLLRLTMDRGGHLVGINGSVPLKFLDRTDYDGHDCHDLYVNLLDPVQVDKLLRKHGPFDYVFHLAGYNGGIEFNHRHPADIFHHNTVMGLNLLHQCVRHKVGKVVSVVASCAYGDTENARLGVLKEDEFLEGQPHATVACHGLAKRNLQLASAFFRDQYDFHAVCACPATLYGPGDSFDPIRTKVMGAMVRRFVDAQRAGEPSVTVWGTGMPLREFLYVEDAARLLVEVAEKYDDSGVPINLGFGQEIGIGALARLVADAAGYTGHIKYDHTKPDGQYRKRLDLTRMRALLDYDFPVTDLWEGIKQTVAWYKECHP